MSIEAKRAAARKLLEGHPANIYMFRPNSNYLESLVNGLKAGIWWIPHTIALISRVLFWPFIKGIFFMVAVILGCLVWHLVLLVAGVTGRLCEKEPGR